MMLIYLAVLSEWNCILIVPFLENVQNLLSDKYFKSRTRSIMVCSLYMMTYVFAILCFQHLLSSSMDKTVRLWHLPSKSCLKTFSHSDYGEFPSSSIAFSICTLW